MTDGERRVSVEQRKMLYSGQLLTNGDVYCEIRDTKRGFRLWPIKSYPESGDLSYLRKL